MKKLFRKMLLFTWVVAAVLSCTCCRPSSKEEELVADYNSPQQAIQAYRNGTDVVGKTVAVTATMDCLEGVFYYYPDTTIKANIYVALVSENKGEGILKDDTVVVTIEDIDDHLVYSIYIYGVLE